MSARLLRESVRLMPRYRTVRVSPRIPIAIILGAAALAYLLGL